jgi:hypothetical protein
MAKTKRRWNAFWVSVIECVQWSCKDRNFHSSTRTPRIRPTRFLPSKHQLILLRLAAAPLPLPAWFARCIIGELPMKELSRIELERLTLPGLLGKLSAAPTCARILSCKLPMAGVCALNCSRCCCCRCAETLADRLALCCAKEFCTSELSSSELELESSSSVSVC